MEFDAGHPALPATGFTFADSWKPTVLRDADGGRALHWGKGPICGAPLYHSTMRGIAMLRRQCPEKIIVASGSVMTPDQAEECIKAGADAVQLRSAVYLHGYRRAKEMTEKVKTR